MNDRYLYRAKRTDDGAWMEGYYCQKRTGHYEGHRFVREIQHIIILEMTGGGYQYAVVDQSTICQCTAMPDKNRKIAYEHDIIKTPVGNAKIAWSRSQSPTDNHINVGFEVVFLDAIANDNYRHDLGYWIGKSKVIGNIFDNPELLEVGE